jgi:hypothetical protein
VGEFAAVFTIGLLVALVALPLTIVQFTLIWPIFFVQTWIFIIRK